MKIATWNVNSLRARFENVITWLRTTSPDVVLLQEIKCEETVFPFEALQDEGYSAAVYGQKTYNGVAILSKYRIEDVQTSFPNNPLPQESRYIQGLIDGWLTVASVYVPNGQTKDSLKYPGKIAFLDELSNHLSKKIDHFLMGGDYNIVPQDHDMTFPENWLGDVPCTDLERTKYQDLLLRAGLSDCLYEQRMPSEEDLTWWDYRAGSFQKNKGLRIDHILVCDKIKSLLLNFGTDRETRGWERPSDHIPVWCELKQ